MQKKQTAQQEQEQKIPGNRAGSQEQDPQASSQDTAAVEDDGSPVLDEQDLEENNLSEEEAENIEWDAEKGSGNA